VAPVPGRRYISDSWVSFLSLNLNVLIKEAANSIFRTVTYKYIEENFAAVHMELTPEESQHIRELVDKASVFGDRYPKDHALGLFADTPLPEG
jgi:diketogulonate reductase-like aldo/keto reductase